MSSSRPLTNMPAPSTEQRARPYMRTLSVEGTVISLAAVAAVEVSAAYSANLSLEGFIFAFVTSVVAYLCWTERRSAFLVASVLALLTAVGAFPFPPQIRPVGTTFDAATDSLLVLGSLLAFIFGFRAYREMGHPTPG
jgi:hypothetical protein